MLSFYSDIEDLYNSLDTFSQMDYVTNASSYNYANKQYHYELSNDAALVTGLAVTEHNLHGQSWED